MFKNSIEELQFPPEFNDIKPSQYKFILPKILDFLIKTHQCGDDILYLQTLTKINEILANINNIIEQELQKILVNQHITDNDEKIALLRLLINEIRQYKKIVQSKFCLKMEHDTTLQYPPQPSRTCDRHLYKPDQVAL